MGDHTRETIDLPRRQDTQRKLRVLKELADSAKPVSIKPLTVDPSCRKLLPERMARECCAVTIDHSSDASTVAMADVADLSALYELNCHFRNLKLVKATRKQVEQTIDELYW